MEGEVGKVEEARVVLAKNVKPGVPFVIKGTVSEVTSLKATCRDSFVMHFRLQDESGTIVVEAFGDVAKAVAVNVEVGCAVVVSGGQVKIADKAYMKKTDVGRKIELKDPGQAVFEQKEVVLTKIVELKKKTVGCVVNLVGGVRAMDDVESAGNQKIRRVYFGDESAYVTLKCWNEAKDFFENGKWYYVGNCKVAYYGGLEVAVNASCKIKKFEEAQDKSGSWKSDELDFVDQFQEVDKSAD